MKTSNKTFLAHFNKQLVHALRFLVVSNFLGHPVLHKGLLQKPAKILQTTSFQLECDQIVKKSFLKGSYAPFYQKIIQHDSILSTCTRKMMTQNKMVSSVTDHHQTQRPVSLRSWRCLRRVSQLSAPNSCINRKVRLVCQIMANTKLKITRINTLP